MVCVVLYVVVAGRKKIKTLTHGLFCLVSIGLALRKLTQLFLLFALLRVYRVSKYSTHELFIFFFSTRSVCLLMFCFGYVSMLDSDKREKQE